MGTLPKHPNVRRISTGVAATALAFGLTACAQLVPEGGGYAETIPAALVASDLGITEAIATKSTAGEQTSVGVAVYVTLDRDTMSTEELEATLLLIEPLIDQPGASYLEYSVWSPGGVQSGDLLDLEPAAHGLTARWQTLDPEGAGNFIAGYASLDDLAAFVNLVDGAGA